SRGMLLVDDAGPACRRQKARPPSNREQARSDKKSLVDHLDDHVAGSAGGDLRMNVKLLSVKTVMTTGRIIPFWSLVFALNSLQNAMMLTPCAPSAGPTGGAGFAAPAGNWRRM